MKNARVTFLGVLVTASLALGLASGSAFGGTGSEPGVVHAPKPTHTPRTQAGAGTIDPEVGLVKMKEDKRRPSYLAHPTPPPGSSNRPAAKATVAPPRSHPHS
ncbi:MAG TPA: hypothetical protein VMV18_15245 [bacterium]|nr:hypothetical protein [bacterium]